MLRIRAAQALLKLGQTERAIPLLEDAIARDWRSQPTLWLNNHFLHSAYASLFDLHFVTQPERARALFWKANEVFAEEGFPWVRPVQAALRARLAAFSDWSKEWAAIRPA